MYVIKNALRCISRSPGRSILIGIIVLVIATSACLGLSIRQAADSAEEEALSGMSITATISFDRSSMMSDIRDQMPSREDFSEGGFSGGFDKDMFSQMMGESSSLTLEEYEKYAKAESVKDFYYTLTSYFNGSDELEPVTTDSSSSSSSSSSSMGGFGGFGGMGGGMPGGFKMAQSGDFTVVGYSSESAMTSFVNGTATITDGAVFEEGTTDADCIISEELATYNSLEVGDVITIVNPNSEEETYQLTVCGIYTDSSSNSSAFGMMGAMTMSDPANMIYMSAAALTEITEHSESISETATDEDTGREFETKLTSSLSGTYVFADTESFEAFEGQVRDMGLDESYTISSSDLTSFENSLAPLETLGTLAGYFLIVVLAIGAVILIVLNIFNIRERKYEIGVLTAMGMKKGKVALQFLTEIFVVTMAAVIIGSTIGAVASVPVTNALLANQIEAKSQQNEAVEENFGRGEMPGGGEMPEMPGGGGGGFGGGGFGGGMPPFGGEDFSFENIRESATSYVSEVNSAVNLNVLLMMLGIAVMLTLVSGAVSMLFVMRYEPLKILANRD